MVAGAIVAIYFAALGLTGKTTFATLAAAAASLPGGVLLTSSSVSNDNAGILTGSLTLLAAVKSLTDRPRQWLWLVLYAIAGMLSFGAKYSAYFLFPVTVLLLAMLFPRLRLRKLRLAWVVIVASAAGLLAATFRDTRLGLISSLTDVPSSLARASSLQGWPCDCTLPAQRYWGAIPNLWETFWGSYGWETFHIPSPFYKVFLAVTLTAVAGLLVTAVRRSRSSSLKRWLKTDRGMAWLLLAVAFVSLFLIVDYRYMVTRSDGGSTHGRFLLPALMSMSLFLTLGLYVLPQFLRVAAFTLLFGTCLAVVGYSVYALPRFFGPTLPVYGDPQTAGMQQPAPASYPTGMQLLGWSRTDQAPPGPGGKLHLRLFWGAARPPDFDYSAFVRLMGQEGLVVHGSDHGPGAGIDLLPHMWQPGEVIPDDWTIDIPAGSPAGEYQVEVGLYDYRDLRPISTEDGRTTVIVGTQTVTSGEQR